MTTEKLTLRGLYPLADRFYHTAPPTSEWRLKERNLRARWNGEPVRMPKRGEWFLSGAFICAYRAPNDLTMTYHVAEIVETETITTVNVLGTAKEINFAKGEPT